MLMMNRERDKKSETNRVKFDSVRDLEKATNT